MGARYVTLPACSIFDPSNMNIYYFMKTFMGASIMKLTDDLRFLKTLSEKLGNLYYDQIQLAYRLNHYFLDTIYLAACMAYLVKIWGIEINEVE